MCEHTACPCEGRGRLADQRPRERGTGGRVPAEDATRPLPHQTPTPLRELRVGGVGQRHRGRRPGLLQSPGDQAQPCQQDREDGAPGEPEPGAEGAVEGGSGKPTATLAVGGSGQHQEHVEDQVGRDEACGARDRHSQERRQPQCPGHRGAPHLRGDHGYRVGAAESQQAQSTLDTSAPGAEYRKDRQQADEEHIQPHVPQDRSAGTRPEGGPGLQRPDFRCSDLTALPPPGGPPSTRNQYV